MVSVIWTLAVNKTVAGPLARKYAKFETKKETSSNDECKVGWQYKVALSGCTAVSGRRGVGGQRDDRRQARRRRLAHNGR